jgi:hypothetical protein
MADFGAEGADLEGIVALRDVADADKLVSLISSTKEAGGKVNMLGECCVTSCLQVFAWTSDAEMQTSWLHYLKHPTCCCT